MISSYIPDRFSELEDKAIYLVYGSDIFMGIYRGEVIKQYEDKIGRAHV